MASERKNPNNVFLSQIVRQENLKKPVRYMLIAHIVFIAVATLGLPHLKKEPFDMTRAVTVDLVAPTAENSMAPNTSKSPKLFTPQAKPDPKPKEPAKAQPEKPPVAAKSDAANKLDAIKKPPEKVEPPKEKVEKPKPIEKVKLDPPKKTEPKKEEPKKTRDDGAGTQAEKEEFNSVLKNLLGAETTDDKPDGNPIDAPFDPSKMVEGIAPTTSETLALSEMDALKYQLAQCWNVPSGAMNAEELIVDIRVQVNPDRTVKAADIVDTGRYNRDTFFRAAADSARRALFNPRCNPLAVPADKYNVWKTMLIRFNPREMFGG